MTRGRIAPLCLAAAASMLAACASAPQGTAAAGPACPDFVPPARTGPVSVPVPDSFLAARIGGLVVDEVVVGADGAVRTVRPVRARFPELTPYTRAVLQRSKLTPATIQGNPVAVRVLVPTFVGVSVAVRREPTFDTVWAFVPGGESREAQWQLRDSVSRLTIALHVENPMPNGFEVVAKAPDGSERSLWKGTVATPPAEVRETVATGKFFYATGDYRIELRSGGKTVNSAMLTIANGHETSIVNACEPLAK